MPEANDMRARLRSTIEEIVEQRLADMQPSDGKGLAVIEQRLTALEEKSQSSVKSELNTAIKELRARRDEITDLHDQLAAVETGLRKELEDHVEKVATLEQNIDEMIKRKEDEFMQLLSRGDPAVNKKMNDQFLKWLAGMEREIHDKLDGTKDLREKVGQMEKDMVTQQQLQELEEHLLAPIEKMQKRIDDAIEKKIEEYTEDLKKAAMGVDAKVIQKEVLAILEEREKKQTASLREELERMEKEKSGEGEE